MATVKNRGKILDAVLEMHGVGLMTAAAASTAVDLGGGALQRDSQVYVEGQLILDITAVSTAASTDCFSIMFQGSHDSTFTTFHTLFELHLGQMANDQDRSGGPWATGVWRSSVVTATGAADLPVRHTLPFCNDYGGVVYRWVRLVTTTGTPGTGINYYAFLTKNCF